MAATETNQCAHPSCTCPALPGSEYCSVQCAAMEEIPDIDCRVQSSRVQRKSALACVFRFNHSQGTTMRSVEE
jgi:hypothetical protein